MGLIDGDGSLGGLIGGGRGASGLDFSALTALPSSAYATFTTHAETAVTAANTELSTSLTAQDVIDALAVGRGFCFPTYGGCLDASGGSVVSVGSDVGALQTVTGIEIATQNNAVTQPTLTIDGLLSEDGDSMSLGNLSTWTEGEAFIVPDVDETGNRRSLWEIGALGNSSIPFSDNKVYDSFGGSVRLTSPVISGVQNASIYNPRNSANVLTANWNGTQILNGSSPTSFSSDARLLRGSAGYQGLVKALSLNSSLYTTNQRAMLKHFLAALFSITVA
jgi:hypothetical protein